MNFLLSVLIAFHFIVLPQGMIFGNAAAGGTFTVPSSISCANAGAGASCTTTALSVTAGQTLIGNVSGCAASPSCSGNVGSTYSAIDSQGDTLTCPAGTVSPAGFYQTGLCYVCSAIGGSTTFTPTSSGAGDYYVGGAFAIVTGVKPSACEDTATDNSLYNATVTSPTITSGTVGQTGEFCFSLVSADNVPSALQTSIATFATNRNMQWTTGPTSGTQTMGWTIASGKVAASILCLKHP